MSINCWMDKQNVWISNGILLSDEKERVTDTWQHMDEVWKHPAKWKKIVTEGHIVYASIYINVQNKQIHRGRNRLVVVKRKGEGRKESDGKQIQGLLWGWWKYSRIS